MDRRTRRIQEEFSGDFDIYVVVTNELKLATLHELQTVYNTADLYDLLEIIEVDAEMKDIAAEKIKQQEAANRGA